MCTVIIASPVVTTTQILASKQESGCMMVKRQAAVCPTQGLCSTAHGARKGESAGIRAGQAAVSPTLQRQWPLRQRLGWCRSARSPGTGQRRWLRPPSAGSSATASGRPSGCWRTAWRSDPLPLCDGRAAAWSPPPTGRRCRRCHRWLATGLLAGVN